MLDGQVEVDGEVVTRLGTKVDPRTAVIRVERQAAAADLATRSTSSLNKPRGVVSTMSDPEGRRTLRRPGRRPARAALPRRPARHRHRGPDPPHQRRRLRPAAGAPVVRGGQDLRRRGRGRDLHARTLKQLLDGRHPRRRPGRPSSRRASDRGHGATAEVDRRAGHPRGPQPDRAPAARPHRPPGAPAHPHPDRAGRAAAACCRGRCAT